MDAMNVAGAAICLGLGFLGLLAPKAAAKLVGLTAHAPHGASEFRATYGGLFGVLGGVPLATGEPAHYAFSGLCWVGAALGRLTSILIDRTSTRMNWAGVAMETVIGGLFLIGELLKSLRAIVS